MPRTKANSIETMGIEKFLNTQFAYLEEPFKMKPYDKFVELINHPNAEIARAFSTEGRQIHYQTVANWRDNYVREQEDWISSP